MCPSDPPDGCCLDGQLGEEDALLVVGGTRALPSSWARPPYPAPAPRNSCTEAPSSPKAPTGRPDIMGPLLLRWVPGYQAVGTSLNRLPSMTGVRVRRLGLLASCVTFGRSLNNSVLSLRTAAWAIEGLSCLLTGSGIK